MKKWVLGLLCAGAFIFLIGLDSGWWSGSDDSTGIPTINSTDGADLARRLATAEAEHGICYGWELRDGARTSSPPLSQGSSRGHGVDARTCPRWMVVTTRVTYTGPDSESEDSASVQVDSSSDLAQDEPRAADLERMGLTSAAVIDDPAAATGYGALALPLLLAEKGVVAPQPEAAAANPATPIGRPGSDLLGTHKPLVVTLAVFGGIALISVATGLIGLRRGRRAER